MTLSEEECAQKWTLINETLSKIDALIKDITQKHQKAGDHENNIEIAKLYHAAAYAMTELEKFKLRFTLTSEELKDHLIQIEEDRVEKYEKKLKKTFGKTDENRPFRIDSEVSKRTILHYSDK